MTTQTEVSAYRRFCQRAARVCELAEWEAETGRRLPWSALFVLAVEDRGGHVDLATGAVYLVDPAWMVRCVPTDGGRP